MTLSGVINDRYQIERELGRGGMATVYLARDLRHGSLVALKVLSPDLASVVSGERFTREIRITAGLQHPHILPVFDSGQVDGLPYYVMPFVDGPTVEQRIKAEGPLPIAEALEIACEVADALAHAHAKGFVHRDVKPSNILLAHGHAVVADFGIARAVEPVTTDRDLTKTGIAVGTAAYMSPEQSAGESVDGRADIYSLGCVLYEMLAGKPPFAASTPRALMAKHWMNDVPSLSAVRRTVRASIEALVQKSMAKRPNARYATAAEFEEALQVLSTEEKLVAAGFTPSGNERVLRTGEPAAPSDPRISAITEAMAAPGLSSPETVETPTVSAGVGRTPLSLEITRSKPRPRLMRLVLAVTVLAAAGFGAWQMTRPGDQPLDRKRVIVYPLLVPTDFKGSRNVGEDIGTMIGTALDGAGDLRWIDGWPLLTPEIRQDVRNLTALEARKIARSRRAAWYLTGRIVVQGDSSEVLLELNDVEGDSTVARSRARGVTADAWRTGLHAVNTLLPSLIPAGSRDVDILAEWTDRDPAAVASFLLAEGAFRRARTADALEHYRAALRVDSTFGLAAIRGAQAATWNHRSDEAESFIELALRQDLPSRYTHFARGYAAYLAGAADSAAAEFRRGLALDPEMAVAWMQLGEVYVHLLPYKGNPDSLARAAFEEARRLDPDAKQILFHLLELRLRSGETKEAEPMLREFLAADPDSVLARQVSLMHECLSTRPDAMNWKASAGLSGLATLSAANSLKGGGATLDCARGGYEAVISADTTQSAAGRRWAAVVGLASSHLARGNAEGAKAVIDSAVARGQGGGSFFLMAAPVFPALRAAAEEVSRRDELTYGRNFETNPYPLRLWQLAIWQVFAGRTNVADAVGRNLEARARTSAQPVDRRLARSARAFVTLARGDTARAVAAFKSLLAEPVPGTEIEWDVAAPRGIERLTLARLLIAEGDFQTAIQVASVFDGAWPSVHLLYLPSSLEVRAEAAAAIPDNRLAARFRNRLAALRGERVVAGSETH